MNSWFLCLQCHSNIATIAGQKRTPGFAYYFSLNIMESGLSLCDSGSISKPVRSLGGFRELQPFVNTVKMIKNDISTQHKMLLPLVTSKKAA